MGETIQVPGIGAPFEWKNTPAGWQSTATELTIESGAETDWYISPVDGGVHANAPLLLFRPTGDFRNSQLKTALSPRTGRRFISGSGLRAGGETPHRIPDQSGRAVGRMTSARSSRATPARRLRLGHRDRAVPVDQNGQRVQRCRDNRRASDRCRSAEAQARDTASDSSVHGSVPSIGGAHPAPNRMLRPSTR
jgi:hypothetical protein